MTITALVSLIAGRLGNRSGLSTLILTELQMAQVVLERDATLPWFLLKSATLSTVAETRTVAVPSDFLRELTESGGPYLAYVDGTEACEDELGKFDYEVLRADSELTGSGRPSKYALVGTDFYLFKKPDAVYSMDFLYYAQDSVPSAAENLWSKYAPDLLGSKAGFEVAKYLRDPVAMQNFSAAVGEAKSRLIIDNTAREQAALQAFLGG